MALLKLIVPFLLDAAAVVIYCDLFGIAACAPKLTVQGGAAAVVINHNWKGHPL